MDDVSIAKDIISKVFAFKIVLKPYHAKQVSSDRDETLPWMWTIVALPKISSLRSLPSK
jgi:hypothetical protein